MTNATVLEPRASDDSLAVRFIHEGGQPSGELAREIAEFINRAESTLNIALYDCRLDEDAAKPIRNALAARMQAGVEIRLIYDNSHKKPQSHQDFEQVGADFAEPGTHERVDELGLPGEMIRGIQGEGLMHQKFIVRDDEAVWTGSMNFTNDSMARMENTIVSLITRPIAAYYKQDFDQLWTSGHTDESGKFKTEPHPLIYAGKPVTADVDFSPGQGEFINEMVARRVLKARRRIIFCTMLINSSKLLNALMTVLDCEKLELWGVYDRTQMAGVLHQWEGQDFLQWKIDAIQRLLREAEMVGKQSLPYRPGHSHNFMHNKLLIVDDTLITGSYNLSHAAQGNAENMIAIESPDLCEDAISYIRFLRNRFLENPAGTD